MKAPTAARILGVAFLLAGALGFAPFVTTPAPMTAEYLLLSGNYGLIFGLFPVNGVHDLLHVALGAWGAFAAFAFRPAVVYLRSVFWLCALLGLFGLFRITGTLFGAMPVYGYDVWLDLIVALYALYGGYGAPSNPPPPEPSDFVAP